MIFKIRLLLKKLYKDKDNNIYLFNIKFLIISIIILFYLIIELINSNIINIEKGINYIRIGILSNSLKNGGVERQTSLILNYLNKIKIFDLYLFTRKEKSKNDYIIDDNIKRIIIKGNIIYLLNEKKIDILIYQQYKLDEIMQLNKLKNVKTIFINRSCFLHWIYYKKNITYMKNVYKAYAKAKYIISLIPFENDYLFNKWGINSILMNNFMPYDYNSIIPSDLSSKNILMIGRGSDKIKRFDLGIESMKYIVNEIFECKMIIISSLKGISHLLGLIQKLNLNKNIEFLGYYSNPEKFYKNASLHIFPTLAEAFPNVLSETLIYGIPSILVGLDYVSTAKGGTVIIYDDSPLSIAKTAIKILLNERLRKKLGKEARKNIVKYKNDLLLKKWIKLILSIYKGGNYYDDLRRMDKKISKKEAITIIENQIYLLKKREKKYKNITINDIENFSFIDNL